MIITFRISNFLSFDEMTEFSMQAGKVESLQTHSIAGKTRNDVSILKTSIIYGANASGKSNFIKAIQFAKTLILKGLSRTPTKNKHFRLDLESEFKLTQFEFEFKYNQKMYAYGVVLSLAERKIKEEWLFELLKTTDKPIFERKVLDNGKSEISIPVKFDKEGMLRFEVYKKDVKDNQLFLYEINDKDINDIQNIQPFKDAFEWFKEGITIIYPNTKFSGLDFIGNDREMKDSFCHFLKLFKTGVEGIETVEQDIDEEFPEKLKEDIYADLNQEGVKSLMVRLGNNSFSFSKNENGEIKLFKLNAQHKVKNSNNVVNFEIDEESDGTQRIMDFIPALVGLTKENKTYLIDEIDRSLHPELTQKIIETFLLNTEGIESQLIATTHESSLLDLNFLRRDEIWFVEKDESGASKMYSLEQYKPRNDKEVRKAYLQGRFGAIPFISNVRELGWFKEFENN
jgi:AAA15 family ATPase/GTPase